MAPDRATGPRRARPGAVVPLLGALVLPGGLPGLPTGPELTERPGVVHELHETRADLAVEGSVVAGRMRFFKKDLEEALGPFLQADAVALTPGPEADALVLRYLRERFQVEADGVPLQPALLRSGEDEMERHPAWWVVVQFTPAQGEAAAAAVPAAGSEAAPAIPSAAGPDGVIRELRIRDTLLFERFEDQRNVVKLVRFPDRWEGTFTFGAEEPERVIRL